MGLSRRYSSLLLEQEANASTFFKAVKSFLVKTMVNAGIAEGILWPKQQYNVGS